MLRLKTTSTHLTKRFVCGFWIKRKAFHFTIILITRMSVDFSENVETIPMPSILDLR